MFTASSGDIRLNQSYCLFLRPSRATSMNLWLDRPWDQLTVTFILQNCTGGWRARKIGLRGPAAVVKPLPPQAAETQKPSCWERQSDHEQSALKEASGASGVRRGSLDVDIRPGLLTGEQRIHLLKRWVSSGWRSGDNFLSKTHLVFLMVLFSSLKKKNPLLLHACDLSTFI